MLESLRTKKGKDDHPFLFLKMLCREFLGLLLTFLQLKTRAKLKNISIKVNLVSAIPTTFSTLTSHQHYNW